MGIRDKYDPIYQDIVGRLIAVRKGKGITQHDLATAMDIDQSQVSKFERFERRLDILDYARYCRALRIDPGEILRDINWSVRAKSPGRR